MFLLFLPGEGSSQVRSSIKYPVIEEEEKEEAIKEVEELPEQPCLASANDPLRLFLKLFREYLLNASSLGLTCINQHLFSRKRPPGTTI